GAVIQRNIEGQVRRGNFERHYNLLIPPRLRGGWPSQRVRPSAGPMTSSARSGGVAAHGQRAPSGAQKRATLPEDGEGFYRSGCNPTSSHRRATAAISASPGQTFGGNRAPRSGSGS